MMKLEGLKFFLASNLPSLISQFCYLDNLEDLGQPLIEQLSSCRSLKE